MSPPERALTEALAGRYVVEEPVGSGGMAVVYRAHDLRHDRKVALKVLRSELSSTLGGERFLREIKLAARLQHPYILPLHDSGEAAGSLYFVMPLIEGETLRSRIARERQLPVDEALRIAAQVADALQYAHERDIVHRDVKPENIMLTSGHAMVMDFGIARAISNAAGMTLTEKGMAIGTPAYMSPEQALDGGHIDGRSDVYSLGCVLYEMLTGIAPFPGADAHIVLMRHSVEAPTPMRGMRPTVTPEVESVVLKALSKSPADRYQTARDFAAALRTAEVPKRTMQPATRWVIAASAIGAAALAGGLAYWSGGQAASPKRTASIAVAPLRLPPGDTADLFLQAGLAQDVTNALSRVEGLQPVAYSAVAAAADAAGDSSALAVGRAVHADYVLSLSLRRVGEQFSITSEVITIADNSVAPFSPGVFTGRERNAFEASVGITRHVVTELSREYALRMTGTRPAVDPEAYRLYLQSLQYENVIYPDLRKRRQLLEQSVAIDSTFADAWASLAGTYGGLTQYSGESPAVLRGLRSRALRKALTLDSLNARARMSIAADLGSEWDFEGAAREYLAVIRMQPDDAVTHSMYGKFLDAVPRLVDSAMAEVRRAIRLDSTSAHNRMLIAYLQLWKNNYAAADSAIDAALKLDPRDWTAYVMRSRERLRQGRPLEALAAMRAAHAIQGPDDPFSLSYVGYAFGAAGMRDSARAVLATLERMVSDGQYVESPWFAMARCGVGDADGAVSALRDAHQKRDVDALLAMQELQNDLNEHPGYQRILRDGGLDKYWKGTKRVAFSETRVCPPNPAPRRP